MNVDLDAVKDWLDLLHGDSTGFMHVCSTGNWEGLVCENTEQALGYVKTIDLRQPSGIYIRATTINTNQLLPGSRGSNKDTACLPGLWADVDVAGPGHKHDPTKKQGLELPPTFDDAVRIVVDSGLPDPTLWINSGGGLYPWWLLREPVTIQDPEHLETVETLSEHWQMILANSAKQLGWHYGTETKDLARVLRLPGTINRKVSGAPRLCRVATELGGGTTYSFGELFQAAIQNLPKVQRPERPLPARVTESGDDDLTPGDALEDMPWDHPMLLGLDWELHHRVGDTSYWTRPGKSRKDGYSATTGYDPGRDRLYVFSSSTPLPTLEPLNKFAVYSYLNHNGDFASAAAELRRRGMGGRRTVEVAAPEPWNPTPPEEPVVTGTVRWSRFSWDDLGNAERFAFRYSDRVRWLVDAERWVVYGDGRWEEATEAQATVLVHQLIDDLPRLETDLYSDEPMVAANGKQMPTEREQFLTWVAKQRMDARIRAMLRNAVGRPELHAKSSEFDRNPMLLNCLNGVLDLRTATLYPHRPDQFLMQQATTNWDENAKCPMWLEYLSRTMPDPEMQAYLKRITGYSITGDVSERVVFIHHGGGNNGKSVYLDAMGRILGSYSITVAAETLMSKQFQGNHNADIARMTKRRFLRTSESNLGRHLDEGQIKLLAGGDDKIVARYPYQRYPIEFYPTGKLNFATNHFPEASDSNSIWRRIRLVSWDTKIPDHEIIKHLTDELVREERSGILAWAVQGCLEWQRIGLAIPATAELRELEHRDNVSVIRQFLMDSSREENGHQETFSHIYQVYRNWCDANGQRAMTGKALSMALQERGYQRWRTQNAKGFIGLRMITQLQVETDWRSQP